MTGLRVDELTVRGAHGDRLHRVTVHVAPGRCVGVLGANGAGKTTLCLAVMGVVPCDEGRIAINDADMGPWPPQRRARCAGLLWQNPEDQLLGPTVLADVCLGTDGDENRAREALRLAGADRLAQRSIDALSFGEKKRVALAGVLAADPDVLLLDEPTAGLDPQACAAMCATMGALCARGKAVLWTGHDIDAMFAHCDHLVCLHAGRVVLEGAPDQVAARGDVLRRIGLRQPVLAQLFSGCARPPVTLEQARRLLRPKEE